MIAADVSTHSPRGETPKFLITDSGDFSTTEINFGGNSAFRILLHSPQEVVNFKNNFLWAFEDPKTARE